MMTDKQKAQAFDLIMSGKVTGMPTFWNNFSQLQGQPDNKVLEQMPKFACMEAVAIVLNHEYVEGD